VHVPPWVHLPTWRGTVKVSNKRKYIYIKFVLKYLYIYQWILFSNIIICLLLIISMNNDDKILTYKILGVHVHLSKCWKGTDLSAEILKGYMLICWNAEGVHDKQKVGHPWGKQILSSRSLCSIYCLVKITRGKSVLILLVIRAFTFCFWYQMACYSIYKKFCQWELMHQVQDQ